MFVIAEPYWPNQLPPSIPVSVITALVAAIIDIDVVYEYVVHVPVEINCVVVAPMVCISELDEL